MSDPVVPNAVPSLVVHTALQANTILLAQGGELIARLGPARFDEKVATCFNSSAGGHFRHVIEHYQAVLAARGSGLVDYEGRVRDRRIETEAEFARQSIDAVVAQLQEMLEQGAPDRSLLVASETTEGAELATTLGRELEFLISHTVHHYALIAVIAGHHGVLPPVNFGMAPSTLRFQAEQAASCAR